jgi:hypothetical protein
MKTQGDVSMTNARTALLVAIALAASAPGIVAAQKLEQARNVEPGDKIQFNWVLNGKAQAFEEEWNSANGDEAVGVQRTGGKEIPLVAPKVGTVSQATCLSNGQPCTFSPPVNFMELPLEKGKKWQQAFTVKGETFTSQVESEWQVDKVEKVKTAAGEFEAFRISHKGRIRGTDAKGSAFSGKEDGRYWVATVSGKLAVVKIEYRNSFGEKFTREATAIAYK